MTVTTSCDNHPTAGSDNANDMGRPIGNNQKRKKCYRIFSQYVHGYLGKGVRKQLPSCVLENVRKLFPAEESEEYMGFKDE